VSDLEGHSRSLMVAILQKKKTVDNMLTIETRSHPEMGGDVACDLEL